MDAKTTVKTCFVLHAGELKIGGFRIYVFQNFPSAGALGCEMYLGHTRSGYRFLLGSVLEQYPEYRGR